MISLPIIETVVNSITFIMMSAGLAGLFALMAVESFGIPPLPSEIILPFAGFLVAAGTYSFPAAFAAALIGGVTGSYVGYAVGRYGRKFLVRGPKFIRLDPKHLASMDSFFTRHGEGTVLFARLVPIVRAYISYPAGAAKMSPGRFGIYTAIGAAPFTFVLMYAGYVLNQRWHDIVPYFQKLDYVAAGFIVVALVYLLLRWRGVITSGFPPRRAPKVAAPGAPEPEPTPTSTGP
ncbi:MAG: DedA family protein [Thermoplasmata archaeon]|nr:DedA family protein [Thermoplasmata archaeon]